MNAAKSIACALTVLLFAVEVSAQTPLGTVFTYQGQLKNAGSPANGSFNMVFELFDVPTGGVALNTQFFPGTTVTNGLFTVQLDFGNLYDGNQRWLDITVNGTTLTPRQELTAAPYALFSAGPWTKDGANLYYNNGNVGIGTSSPTSKLVVTGSANAALINGIASSGTGVYGASSGPGNDPGTGVQGSSSDPNGTGVYGFANSSTGQNIGVYGRTASAQGYAGYFFGANNYFSGNVGIGTLFPTAKLHIAGSAGVDGIRFPDGTLQTTAAAGSSSAGKLVASGFISGSIFVTINNPNPVWQFYGPTTNVTLAAGQRLQVIASAAIGINTGPSAFSIDVAYQLQGNPTITNFAGGGYMDVKTVSGMRSTWALNGHATGLAAGTYAIGVVVRSTTAALNDNDFVNLSYMVFNAP